MMNEWLNQEGFPPGRVTILDAAKAHIVNAPEAITPFDAWTLKTNVPSVGRTIC